MQDKEINEIKDIEIDLLVKAIDQVYGYDFSDYAYASLKRRIKKRMQAEKLMTVSALQEKIIHNQECMKKFLNDISINVTAMYRDPWFYQSFREKVVPFLKTYPFIRIWHAGCSNGEEVYSIAILLEEENLYSRTQIYATDINEDCLDRAQKAIYPIRCMQEYTQNYMAAGGKKEFSTYYLSKDDSVIFKNRLKKNIVFAQHNLVSDRSFNEFNVIFCRNVMIYFNRPLQNRVLQLIHQSLSLFGFLCTGAKESISFSTIEPFYELMDSKSKIYKRIR